MLVAVPVGVWVARAPGGEFVYANRTFTEIMGMTARADVAAGEYAAPYGICGLDGEPYPEDRMPFVQALRARETVIVDDIVIHRTDGGRVNIRASARPVFGGDGEIAYVVIAFIDISREVAAERARLESEARLRRAHRLESVGTLAGGIAHDFNNLLAAVRTLASTLEVEDPDPARKADLRRIVDVTDSAVQLTRALLGFAGRGRNLSAPVSIDEVVGSLGEILKRTLGRGIEVAVHLGAGRHVVTGDFSQLQQVVLNLVVNARDAIEGPGRIEVRTSAGEGEVVLEVTDTGTGIDPAIRDRIFEPYFTTRTAGPTHGAGLGLATAYGIVDGHGGTIEVGDNPVARGTRMRVRLPARPGVSPAPAASAEGRALSRGSGLVLLAEDEPAVRHSVERALVLLGYEVVLAADGVEAVARFGERHGELAAVLLDMSMPRMGGRAAYQAMATVDPCVPVLLMTGYALNHEAQEILDLGVRGFLPKPFDVRALSAAIERARQGPSR